MDIIFSPFSYSYFSNLRNPEWSANNVLSFISGFLECLARKNPRSWTYQHRPIFSTEFILDMTTNQTNFWVRPLNRLQQYSVRPKISGESFFLGLTNDSGFSMELKERKRVPETVVKVRLTDLDNRSSCKRPIDNTP